MEKDIKADADGLKIELTEIQGKEKQLLAAFQECQEGRCACPTNEYSKLESLEIEQTDGKINLRLSAKEGEVFDTAEIGRCLDYTEKKVISSK